MNTKAVRYLMKRNLSLMLAMLILLLPASCDKGIHENEYPLSEGQGAMIIGLDSGAEVEDLTLYLFGSDGTAALCETYDNPRELASGHIPVPAGSYTLVVVANAGTATPTKADALPRQTTLPDLVEWLKAHAADFPGMLTASEQIEVGAGDIERLRLVLTDGTGGIRLSTVRLALTVPGLDLPAYATRAGGDSKPLRCVAEVYQTGTNNRVHRHVQDCALQSDGTYFAELSLMPGDYDLHLWADWDGGYYNADDLNKVLVLTDNYVANGETDKKDAYYGSLSLTLPSGEGTQTGQSSSTGGVEGAGVEGASVSLMRPFAKYRLIATDVEAYYNLIEKGEALPPIEDLQVRVTYEGFFPTGFNVATGKPNDALNTGIHYTSVPTVAEGYDAKVNRQVGADFVLTNGEESFVNVTIQMVDTRTGDIVATVQHVKIPYKRGHLTTVTGHFLTAGKTPGGVQIDTEWGDDVVIEF